MTERGNHQAEALARELESDLVRLHGMLLPSSVLARLLAYPSSGAYRKALHQERLPVPVFTLANRRGHFALAKDVARWMANERMGASVPKEATM